VQTSPPERHRVENAVQGVDVVSTGKGGWKCRGVGPRARPSCESKSSCGVQVLTAAGARAAEASWKTGRTNSALNPLRHRGVFQACKEERNDLGRSLPLLASSLPAKAEQQASDHRKDITYHFSRDPSSHPWLTRPTHSTPLPAATRLRFCPGRPPDRPIVSATKH